MLVSYQNKNTIFSASITGEPLLFREFKTFISFLNKNKLEDKKEIYKKVIEENIFQYKSPKSSLRRINPLFKRYSSLSEELREVVLNGNLQDATVASLFALYKTNTLFSEFFNSVLSEKFKTRDLSFSKMDIYSFLNRIEIDHSEVSVWKDYTKTKIVQVITSILKDSMILNSSQSLQKCSLTHSVKEMIIADGGKLFLDIIELK